MLVGPVDSLIREHLDGDQKEWSKNHDCTVKIREMTPSTEYAQLATKLVLVNEGSELKGEEILPFLHEKGKDKIWDSFRYAKFHLGDAINGKYLRSSMFKWPDLSPGGARVALRSWNQADEAGYSQKYPGASDFFEPEKVKKKK